MSQHTLSFISKTAQSAMLIVIFVIAIAAPVQAESLQWESKDNVDLQKEWTITFNVEIEDSVENKSHFEIRRADGSLFQTEVTFEGNKAIVTPGSSGYLPETTYELHIKEGVTFSNGEQYQDVLTMPFSTKSESYFDQELKELVYQGKVKDVPYTIGDSINDVIADRGEPTNEFGYSGLKYISYPDNYWFGTNFGDTTLRAIGVPLQQDRYTLADFEKVFGEATGYGPPGEGSSNYWAYFNLPGYKLVLHIDGDYRTSPVSDFILAERQ
ncbi:DUF4309 domain-containing protein [Halobacillus locisalis]|uniref:DUF4309 domain-containing protein n=1 Tax=Halobacillus locisalis TaxID=220753 RepID=A0A838CUC5_9BACI|nr:DUF4309 domain-containing protein [Halobacillus locisalis]MBA2175409.1 DUF4309 domain-containing protein [Halobacillus locisalis]